jgi:hypothetical protein
LNQRGKTGSVKGWKGKLTDRFRKRMKRQVDRQVREEDEKASWQKGSFTQKGEKTEFSLKCTLHIWSLSLTVHEKCACKNYNYTFFYLYICTVYVHTSWDL